MCRSFSFLDPPSYLLHAVCKRYGPAAACCSAGLFGPAASSAPLEQRVQLAFERLDTALLLVVDPLLLLVASNLLLQLVEEEHVQGLVVDGLHLAVGAANRRSGKTSATSSATRPHSNRFLRR